MSARGCYSIVALVTVLSPAQVVWAMPQAPASEKVTGAAPDAALVAALLAKLKAETTSVPRTATSEVIEARLAAVVEEAGAACPVAVEALRQLASDGAVSANARAGAAALQKVTGARCLRGTGALGDGSSSPNRGVGTGGTSGLFITPPFVSGGGGSDYVS